MPELTDLERNLTAMLRQRAYTARRPLDHESTLAVVGRARRRRARTAGLAATLVLALVVALGGVLVTGTDRHRTLPAPPAPRVGRLVALGPDGLLSVTAGGKETPFLADDIDVTGLEFDVPVWSPGGTRLAFLAGDVARGPVGKMAVYVVKADGTKLRKVVDCPGIGSCGTELGAGPAWSPDGSRIALVGDGLLVVDVDSGVLQRLTLDTGGEVAAAPAWSPDGLRLAYARHDDVRVVQVEATGGAAVGDVMVTVDGVTDVRTLDWSPSGTQLAISAVDGVHIADLGPQLPESGPTAPVTAAKVVAQRTGEGPAAASWSPDGRHLAYFTTPRVDGGFTAQLRVLDVSTGDDRVVHESPCCVSDWSPPQWSSGGTELVLSIQLDGAPQASGLFVVRVDGSGAERLTADPLTDPMWRP